MLRFRRYRVFLILAVFTVTVLYYFTNWEAATSISVESLKNHGQKDRPKPDIGGAPFTPLTTRENNVRPQISAESTDPLTLATPTSTRKDATLGSIEQKQTATAQALIPTPKSYFEASVESTLSSMAANGDTTAASTPTPSPQIAPGPVIAQDGQGRKEVPPPLTNRPAKHWTKLPEHFPVPTGSLIQLPTGKSQVIPQIQHIFKDESPSARIDRMRKLETIQEAFKHAWSGYRAHAWLHDELKPVSGGSEDPFGGWAATLVDALDTLWIMGLREEFQEAVKAIEKIDFTTSNRANIPLFETTIRYLGGLVAAHDLSKGEYKILLTKAIELAEILMGAFDTPNRMPATFYTWKPTFAANRKRASARIVLAEIGSLSVEFTRLAQITKEAKYYDAVARITNEFELWQNHTSIPGLFPKYVDGSGCKKPEYTYTPPVETPLPPAEESTSIAAKPTPLVEKGASLEDPISPVEKPAPAGLKSRPWRMGDGGQGANGMEKFKRKRQIDMDSLAENAPQSEKPVIPQEETIGKIVGGVPPPKPDLSESTSTQSTPMSRPTEQCVTQGLASPQGSSDEDFTLGAMADSLYEYFPKQYMLLEGREPQYRSMYEQAIEAASKHLIFRPMIPDSDKRSILVLGSASVHQVPDKPELIVLRPEQQHLQCFAGGMWALGAQVFGRKEDLEIAAKLTDGCVWAYESTQSGIMPESHTHIKCETRDKCDWNQTSWYETLDPSRASREESYQIKKQALVDTEARSRPAEASKQTSLVDDAEPIRIHSASSTSGAEFAGSTSAPLGKRQLEIEEHEHAHHPLAQMATASPTVKDPTSNPKEKVKQDDAQISAAEESKTPIIPSKIPNLYPSHEEYVENKIAEERIIPGIPFVSGKNYLLRPEAIESVFIMYRITGDEIWREKGWKMFEAIQNHTRVRYGNSAIDDVTAAEPQPMDSMESFWLAETLKYFFLLFSTPDIISLDDYVFNTEAHPFKRPKSIS